jgi:signal peptidase I
LEYERTLHARPSFTGCLLKCLLIVAIGVATFLAVPTVVQLVRVQGDSMTPSLQGGQIILVNRVAYRLQPVRHGDIIVFQSPEAAQDILVKRVIALPGENVALKQGKLFIDNVPVAEPYVAQLDADGFGPLKVQDGTLFVLGDHRGVSNDSRSWGLLPMGLVAGRAEFSIWPPLPAP